MLHVFHTCVACILFGCCVSVFASVSKFKRMFQVFHLSFFCKLQVLYIDVWKVDRVFSYGMKWEGVRAAPVDARSGWCSGGACPCGCARRRRGQATSRRAGPPMDVWKRTAPAASGHGCSSRRPALAVPYHFCSDILPPSKFDRRISITEEFSNDTRITIGGARFWLGRGECTL
jgi:hypothetical protein